MAELNQIETREPNWRLRRQHALAEKRQRRAELRRQVERAANSRAAAQLRTLMTRIETEIAGLEAGIAADLKAAAVNERAQNTLGATRAMIARRDNLKCTIRALSERAASMSWRDANTEAG